MSTIAIALIMIAAVVISSWIVRMLPIPVPLPLIQIALGYAITAIGHLGVDLNPHVFMFLFLPPLLFLDGWRIPKEGLAKDMGIITQLAFGLVFLTVVGVGYLIYWLIPGIELPVAFALAAVISPTDPVAVSGIAAKVPFPRRMMHILEGESLFNDASGLVCLKFAIVAAMATLAVATAEDGVAVPHVFSLSSAAFDFTKMVVGGLVVGVVVTWFISQMKLQVSRRWGEETGTQILVSLLIPFLAYLAAEAFNFSGVLAAVAAGITMSYSEIRAQVMAATRIRRGAVWDALQMLANGTMFVLLGEQLPKMVEKLPETVQLAGHENPIWLLFYALMITAALIVMRWGWVWLSFKIMLRISDCSKMVAAQHKDEEVQAPHLQLDWRGKLRRAGDKLKRFFINIPPFLRAFRQTPFQPLNSRLVTAMSVAGVRGSITLAGVLTIPLSIASRDLAIFLASVVILLTLIIASIALPWILKGVEMPTTSNSDSKELEDKARNRAAEAAIKAIEQAQHDMAASSTEPDLFVSVANRIMSTYRTHIEMRDYASAGADSHISAATVRKIETIERQMRLVALAAERNSIYKQAQNRMINEEMMNKLVREIDLTETSIST